MRDAARNARRRTPGAVLPASFYARDTEVVARELLGCIVESHGPRGVVSGRIVETEAYVGEHDPACHAAAGRTPRTDPLYGPPGTAYVYFCYGTHWLLNAVTRPEGLPSAVLIRALEPLEGIATMRSRRRAARRDTDLASGPGKICAALGLDGRHNRLSLKGPQLLIRRGHQYADHEVVVGPRVGIREAVDWPLRWCVAEHPCVSRARQSPVTSHRR
jgi:DNA-3-methyladenine glycosylase